MTTCGCNFQFADGSVRALAADGSVALADMAQAFRRAGSGARAFALGVQGSLLQTALAALRRQGVAIGSLNTRPAAGPLPVLMVIADRADLRPPGAGVLFIAAAGGEPTPLLLPAVQCAREAARRLMPGAPFEPVLVQHGPGAGTLPAEQMALNFKHIRD